jgi:hypothetical protein
VVTADAAAVAGIDEVERPTECKPGVGCIWVPSPGWGLTLLSEGCELLAGAFFVSFAFFVSLAFCVSASLASLAFCFSASLASLAFCFSASLASLAFFLFIRTSLAVDCFYMIYVKSNVQWGKKGLTGIACANGTWTTSVQRSCKPMPSSIRLFRVLKKRFLGNCRKRDRVGMSSVL